MEFTFYDTRLTEDCKTLLIKETVSLNILGEEHCYMIAMNTKIKYWDYF